MYGHYNSCELFEKLQLHLIKTKYFFVELRIMKEREIETLSSELTGM